MPSQTLLSKNDFIKVCGVTRQALYKAIKAGRVKTNKPGTRIILNDPVTQLYFEAQQAKRNLSGIQIEPENNPEEKTNGGDNSQASLLTQKTLEEIKRIKAERRLKELKLAQSREELIERETLGKVLFHYLEALNVNMLSIPEMIVESVEAKVKAGGNRGDIVEGIRDIIQKEIKGTKKQIKSRLK